MAEGINAAIIERLEKVVNTLQDNSMKMGQLLAVHDEKLDKQDRIDAVLFAKIEEIQKTLDRETNLIKAGCERDIRKVDERLRAMEKKMWSIFGGLAIISFLVSPVGQRIIKPILTTAETSAIMNGSLELAFYDSR
tara:strand:+ start:1094 stop:1501 length:408 start_codon:yes stop_codon:yes gene_type:complete